MATGSARVCVKNVPKHVDEKRLKEHFASKGEVTDVKLLRTSEGRSRQLAFIGFRTPAQATEAIKYFNRTYLDTSKLQVEAASAIGSTDGPRAWSKYSVGSSAYERRKPSGEAETAKKAGAKTQGTKTKFATDEEDDPQLKEFLEVMKPRQQSRLWTNDDIVGMTEVEMQQRGAHRPAPSSTNKEEDESGPRGKKSSRAKAKSSGTNQEAGSDDSDDDYQDLNDGDVDDDEDDDEDNNEGPEKDEMVVGTAVSDLDYLKSRVKANFSDDDEEDEEDEGDDSEEGEESESESEGEAEAVKGVQKGGSRTKSSTEHGSEHDAAAAAAADGDGDKADRPRMASEPEPARLFVRNLSYGTTEEELAEAFEAHGALAEVHLVKDRQTGQSKGFAYVLYESPESARRAMQALDKRELQGRLIHVMPAQKAPQKEEPTEVALSPGMSKFKSERQAEKKADAGNKSSWNALFMRPDTVAAAVAARFGISKSELLEPGAQDMAVRLALGETHVIADTKRALAEGGVDIDLLERAAASNRKKHDLPRSGSVMLVKNLPYEVTKTELTLMFEKFGGLGNVVLPPTKTIALIEFLEAADARRAFKACAFKRVGKVPIYLEWAPEGILNGTSELSTPKEDDADAMDESEEAPAPRAAAGSATLFVKNLSFKTDTPALLAHFKKAAPGGLIRAMVKTRPGKDGGPALSCGYGFVTYDTASNSHRAMSLLQSSKLHNHTLTVDMSSRATVGDDEVEEGTKAKSKTKDGLSKTKMVVRNVAFEATKRDLSQLFSPFGQLKSLRVPRKFDGKHRGFAFIEFISKKEASNAYDSLKNTHLHGRHLVLEYAKADENIEDLRERASVQLIGKEKRGKSHADDDPVASKKAKFMVGLVDESQSFGSGFAKL